METNMKTKSRKKQIALFVLYGILTVCLLFTMLSFNDIGAIFQKLGEADGLYILYALLCVLVYLALYPLSLCILTKAEGSDIKMKTTYSIAMTEHFFNGITPFSTGGQPFQAYCFSKAKVKISESTGLLLMNFLVFMLVTNAFAACALFFFDRFVTDTAMTVIAIVGFTMNFIVLGCTVFLGASKTVRGWIMKLIGVLCKIKFLSKVIEPRLPKMQEYLDQVQEAFHKLASKKWHFLLAIVTKIFSMAAYYAATFFILWALGIEVPPSEIFFVIAGTSFAITMVVFLPTPGSAGGIEGSFAAVFQSLIIAEGGVAVGAIAHGGMLIWRLLTYYFVLLISLIFYIGLEVAFSRHKKDELPPDEILTDAELSDGESVNVQSINPNAESSEEVE